MTCRHDWRRVWVGARYTAGFFVLATLCLPARAQEEKDVGAGLGGDGTRTVWLDELDLSLVRQGWKTAQSKRSVEGRQIRIGDAEFDRGVGSHAAGSIHVALDGKARRFQAAVGIDRETRKRGSAAIRIIGGKGVLYQTGILNRRRYRGSGPNRHPHR